MSGPYTPGDLLVANAVGELVQVPVARPGGFAWWQGSGAGYVEGPNSATFSDGSATYVALVSVAVAGKRAIIQLHNQYEPVHGDQGDTPFYLQVGNDGNLTYRQGYGPEIDTGFAVADGNQHLIIAVLSAVGTVVTYNVYADGNLVSTTSRDIDGDLGSVFLTVGRINGFGTTNNLTGKVSQVVAYASPLPAAAVSALVGAWQEGEFGSWRQLVAAFGPHLWWQLNDASVASSAPAADSSGSGLPGVYTGTSAQATTPAFG